MTDDQIATLGQDFDDFLHKIVMNYDVNYPALASVILARMTSLAQITECQDVLLYLLPHMENKLKGDSNGRYH